MNLKDVKKIFIKSALFFTVLLFTSCFREPVPDNLSNSVKQSFNLLPEKPQFVMYINFRKMRMTEFWKDYVSDSVFSAENTFGNLLNVFKSATGTSISSGLDEMYFANTWTGQNAIILKGSFDKSKILSFLATDSSFRKITTTDGKETFIHDESNLTFFFRDNFTICASNYGNQIDFMKQVKDSSDTGLASNKEMLQHINGILYKEYIWMITSEKTFIRGIVANLTDMKRGKNIEKEILSDSISAKDSLSKQEDILINKMFEKINALSISAKMKSELEFALQFEAEDKESAEYLEKLLNGIIIFAKLSSASKKDDYEKRVSDILERFEIINFDNMTVASVKISGKDVDVFRKIKN